MSSASLFLRSVTLLALLGAAAAHVTVNPRETSGNYFFAVVRLPHGCNDPNNSGAGRADSYKIVMTVPEEVEQAGSMRPEVTPGWTSNVDGRVVTWEADSADHHLPDTHILNFGLNMKLPKLVSAGGTKSEGDKLYFPTVQHCVGGVTSDWVGMSHGGDELPAPAVTYVEPVDVDGMVDSMATMDDNIAALTTDLEAARFRMEGMATTSTAHNTRITNLEGPAGDDDVDEDKLLAIAAAGVALGVVGTLLAIASMVVACKASKAAPSLPSVEGASGFMAQKA